MASTTYMSRHWLCEPVNLEKKMIYRWPPIKKFDDIINQYGRKIRIKILEEEEWAVVESRSPEVRVDDVLKEFDIDEFTASRDAAREMYKTHRVHP